MFASFGQGEDVVHFEREVASAAVGAAMIVAIKDAGPVLCGHIARFGLCAAPSFAIPVGKSPRLSLVGKLPDALIVLALPGKDLGSLLKVVILTARARSFGMALSPTTDAIS
jgi:hypothetical protein